MPNNLAFGNKYSKSIFKKMFKVFYSKEIFLNFTTCQSNLKKYIHIQKNFPKYFIWTFYFFNLNLMIYPILIWIIVHIILQFQIIYLQG